MSIVQNDTSSDTARYVRDVTVTGVTTAGVANYRAARSLWTQTVEPYDTPPMNATTTEWTTS